METKAKFNSLFGSFVKSKRLSHGLSQPELADMVGNNFQNISRLERGLISPTLFWVSLLSESFNMSLSEFIVEFEDFKNSKVKGRLNR